MYKIMKLNSIVLALLSLVVLTSCNSGGSSGPSAGYSSGPGAPVIQSMSVSGAAAFPGCTITGAVTAQSPHGLALAYSWSVSDGWTISSGINSNIVYITSPMSYAVPGILTVTVTDEDNRFAVSSISLSTASDSGPVIQSLSLTGAPASPGGVITAAINAQSSAGPGLTYLWSVSNGWTISSGGTTSIVTITAPTSYSATGALTVTVTDAQGFFATSTIPLSTQAPYIYAELNSFTNGSIPPPGCQGACVQVLDFKTRSPISNADVTLNGIGLKYNDAQQKYLGNQVIDPGAKIELVVSLDGKTYTATGSQFTALLAISAPASETIWRNDYAQTVLWTGGTPTLNTYYRLGVVDAATGTILWPTTNTLQSVPTWTSSYSIPANSLTLGDRLVMLGITTKVDIPDAAFGSSLVIGGFDTVHITVTGVTTLASGQSDPSAIALDSTNVYWVESTSNGSVKKIGLNGGAITTLASGLYMPLYIAVDSNNIYWTQELGDVMKKSLDGTNMTTLSSGNSYPMGIAVNSTNVYWVEDCCSFAVKTARLSDGTITTLATGQDYPSAIAVDSNNVYWLNSGSSTGSINKVGLNGGIVTTLATGLNGAMGIAVDSTNLYWVERADSIGANSGTIKKVGLNGGTVTTLASGLIAPTCLAADSTNVYWAGGGTIQKVGLDGGAITTVAAGVIDPSSIAVDSTNVYWTEYYGGNVKKVAK